MIDTDDVWQDNNPDWNPSLEELTILAVAGIPTAIRNSEYSDAAKQWADRMPEDFVPLENTDDALVLAAIYDIWAFPIGHSFHVSCFGCEATGYKRSFLMARSLAELRLAIV